MSRTSSREIRPNEESDRRSDWDGERGTALRRDVERDIDDCHACDAKRKNAFEPPQPHNKTSRVASMDEPFTPRGPLV